MNQKDKQIQNLENFLRSLNERIEKQTEGHTQVATMLTDLVDELGILIKGFYDRALECSSQATTVLVELNEAIRVRDNDRWEDFNMRAWILKGKIDAYLESAELTQELCEKVVGRKDETKH